MGTKVHGNVQKKQKNVLFHFVEKPEFWRPCLVKQSERFQISQRHNCVRAHDVSCGCSDNPWNIEGMKMRFDSSQWYGRDAVEPTPVRGKSYLLLCETRGSPKPLPTIQWYRDGSPLHSSRHFYIIVSVLGVLFYVVRCDLLL